MACYYVMAIAQNLIRNRKRSHGTRPVANSVWRQLQSDWCATANSEVSHIFVIMIHHVPDGLRRTYQYTGDTGVRCYCI